MDGTITTTGTTTTAALGATVIRSDGRLLRIRPVDPSDRDALRQLDAAASDRSLRRRFFTVSRYSADQYTDDVAAQPETASRDSIVAEVGHDIVALATLEALGSDSAEIAVLVSDADQHGGIGTLLLEELVATAQRRGFRHLTADVLSDNTPMLRVLHALGLSMASQSSAGVTRLSIDIGTTAGYAAAMTERESSAERASLRPLRTPQSIAVVGVGSHRHSVGRLLVANLVTGGYRGRIYVVHPRRTEVPGAATVATVADLPESPDVVVVAVRARDVNAVVEASGRRGAHAVVLVSSGFGETDAEGEASQRAVLATARKYGMRLIGPNCLGVVNTDPTVRLNATFAPMPMLSGGLALVSQSGAVGIAIIAAAARRGLGIAEFVSVGNKADVSGNDLLLAWHHDPRVSVIALYLESVGNPRRFARIARTVSRSTPILALKSGRSATGQRAGLSHTAAAAAAEPVVDVLFAQSGVQRVTTLEELLDAARVIDQQPMPRGGRVVIIGNSGGPGILAADAAEAAGLCVIKLGDATRALLRAAVPGLASDQNPVDLGASAQPDQVSAALAVVLAGEESDSVVTVFTETLAASPKQIRQAIVTAAQGSVVPVISTEVGAEPGCVPLDRLGRALPVFAFPKPAIAALAVAVRCGEVRDVADRTYGTPTGLDIERARDVVRTFSARGGGWMDAAASTELLTSIGVPVVAQRVVGNASDAATAARELGYPVVVKLGVGVHKSDVGGVQTDLRNDHDVLQSCARLRNVNATAPLLVQSMHSGTELIVGGIQDPQFGPVVMVGAGGTFTELFGARSLQLAPVGPIETDAMLDTAGLSSLLDGFRGAVPVSRPALADLITRVSRLVEAIPDVAELDLNPVICVADDLVVVDAKIRISPSAPPVYLVSRRL